MQRNCANVVVAGAATLEGCNTYSMQVMATSVVDELEALFSLLARTGTGLADETALTSTQRVVLCELVASGPLRLHSLATRIGGARPPPSPPLGGRAPAGPRRARRPPRRPPPRP